MLIYIKVFSDILQIQETFYITLHINIYNNIPQYNIEYNN